MSTARRSRSRTRLTAAERRELIEAAATEVFAERGYHAAAMNDIARRAGVSVPVVYDHFDSKLDLHRRLLERHYADLRTIWLQAAQRGFGERGAIKDAFDAWFAYVEAHPFASRMLFLDTTGDPQIQAVHRDVAAQSRALMLPLLAAQPQVAAIAEDGDAESVEIVWEILRSVLQGLAIWWSEHPDVSRERIVTTAVNALWSGLANS